MRAIAYEGFGGPDVLQAVELDEPMVAPDNVLIRIEAAGVNPVDAKTRAGRMAERVPHLFPVIPGFDAAGTVERVGPALAGISPGDEVLAFCRKDVIQGGTYAELVSVREAHLAARRGLDSERAAALPLAGLTAYQCLYEGVGIAPGQTVAVRGASGGVGHFAVQLARLAGARVVGIAGAASEPWVRELGADVFIDRATGDLVAALQEAAPDGLDALVDLVGGEDLGSLAAAVRPGGRMTSALVAQPPVALEERDIGFRYIFVRPDSRQLAELVALAHEGDLRIEVVEAMPLEDARRAQERIEGGGVHGKLVLRT